MIIFDFESFSLLFSFKFGKMGIYEMFMFGMTEHNHGWSLIYSIYQRKISLSQPLLSSKNIILRFVITAHQL